MADTLSLETHGPALLVDTGATESYIDNDFAFNLKLPVVGRRHVAGVGGLKEVNMYLAHSHVPTLAFTVYEAFACMDLIAGDQRHFALIGRTFCGGSKWFMMDQPEMSLCHIRKYSKFSNLIPATNPLTSVLSSALGRIAFKPRSSPPARP